MGEWVRWRDTLGLHLRLREPRSIRHDLRRRTCGPSSFASVEIRFSAAEAFDFERRCAWPAGLDPDYTARLDAAIATGILDALQPDDGRPYAADRLRAECVSVEYDEVGSSETAFYAAAWQATRQLRAEATWDLAEQRSE